MSKILQNSIFSYIGISSIIGTYQGWTMYHEYKQNILIKESGIPSKMFNMILGTFTIGVFSIVNGTLWPITYYYTKKINI